MRNMLLLLAIACSSVSLAQTGVQNFDAAGFKVKCNCKLRTNTTFIEMAKQQGKLNVLAAYVCSENENSPETGVVVNINIYDESESYSKISPSKYEFFEKKYLEAYFNNLEQNGFKGSYIIYQGVSAIEYTFDQFGVPTKAVTFLKNKKSYLIQLATRQNLNTKYTVLKNSFEFL